MHIIVIGSFAISCVLMLLTLLNKVTYVQLEIEVNIFQAIWHDDL